MLNAPRFARPLVAAAQAKVLSGSNVLQSFSMSPHPSSLHSHDVDKFHTTNIVVSHDDVNRQTGLMKEALPTSVHGRICSIVVT
jgi:mRNA deadenylase 3'-5' endonuclease subunit Ccr4